MKTSYSIPLPLASEVITVKAEHSARPVRSIAFQDEGVLCARRLLRCTCRQRRGSRTAFYRLGRRVDFPQLADQVIQRGLAEATGFDRRLRLHHLEGVVLVGGRLLQQMILVERGV